VGELTRRELVILSRDMTGLYTSVEKPEKIGMAAHCAAERGKEERGSIIDDVRTLKY
jgi:hypothetical protein